MLTTYDRDKWNEDTHLENVRKAITSQTPPEFVRQHYPYKAVVRSRCVAYNLKAGEIIPYVRVRHCISSFPIEGIAYGTKLDCSRSLCFSSAEVQLVEA